MSSALLRAVRAVRGSPLPRYQQVGLLRCIVEECVWAEPTDGEQPAQKAELRHVGSVGG